MHTDTDHIDQQGTHAATDQQPTDTIEQGPTFEAFDRETDFYPLRLTQV